jgi:hypothetical protein
MTERKALVYFVDPFGDNFSHSEKMLYELICVYMQEGRIVEADMPTPTRRHPFKTRKVYKWIGVKIQELRDLSAEMPPSVTELNAEGSYIHRMVVRTWRSDG